MKILDFLSDETVIADLKSGSKKEVLEELALPVSRMTNIKHDEIVRVLMEREQLGSTGIGGGVGIPHGKLDKLKSMTIGFGRCRTGINFDSIDGLPAHIFFLLLTPADSTALHLSLLSRISKLLRNESFREKLVMAESKEAVLAIIDEADSGLQL